MRIGPDQRTCPACGAAALEPAPVLHHMMCAYVGPQYDFSPVGAALICPKCRRPIVANDAGCEIVGMSARCARCNAEHLL